MNENIVSLKLCKKCGESKRPEEYYKHRNVCKSCRISYDKNRKIDLKDGKRDSDDWYKSEDEMIIPRDIEHVEEDRKNTDVMQMPEEVLMDTTDCSERDNRMIAYVFALIWGAIIYVIVTDIANGGL